MNSIVSSLQDTIQYNNSMATSMMNLRSNIDMINSGFIETTSSINRMAEAHEEINEETEKNKDEILDFKEALGGFAIVSNYADEMAGATAKVKQMSEGLQSAHDIQNQIMQSAQRAGTSYTDMVDTVSQLSSMDDIFKSNNEAIAFTELMNKGMSANGVSGDMQSEIMNQLAQSMSTGTMGVEDIQLMSQYIPELSSGLQEYMNNVRGVEGNLQNMAAQGMISAEDIKNAMFMSSGQIEESFASAPMTFG